MISIKNICFVILFFPLIFNFDVVAFPGDQSSLSCLGKLKTDIQNQYNSIGNSIVDNTSYVCPSAEFPDVEKCKETNKQKAQNRVIEEVRKKHDTSKHLTMLGDSLSDFVDLYGAVDPRKVYGVPIGDVAGYYDGLPFYMDKWDDYLSIGAGLPAGYRQGYQVSNYAKYGFTTVGVMKTLGINLNEEALLKWEIKSDSTGCIQTRPAAVELGVVDGIPESKSAPRSNLMIGGNDIMNSFVANSTWLPFLNKHNADLVLTNITTIADWHLENGKQINTMGEWTFRVRLTDARGKNSVKQIRFVSGL